MYTLYYFTGYYQNVRLFGVSIARNIMTGLITLYNILLLYYTDSQYTARISGGLHITKRKSRRRTCVAICTYMHKSSLRFKERSAVEGRDKEDEYSTC